MESNEKTGSDSYLTNTIDEPDFDLLQTLIDAESQGSGLATELREIFQNFDTKQAEENHIKVQSYLAEMKADKIYSCGLALARNGKKLEAIEVWLPLARQGDATTIDAVIVSLWQMGREHGAKTWLTRLAGLDRGQFNSVIARLEIPEEMAKTFIGK
jgi:hypothetical protein